MRTLFPVVCLVLLTAAVTARPQKIAFLAPEGSARDRIVIGRLTTAMSSGGFDTVDPALAASVLEAGGPEAPFNMTKTEARALGDAIGCHFYVLVRAATQRRISFEKDEFHESHAAFWVVSARTGRLLLWTLEKTSADTPERAVELLAPKIDETAVRISAAVRAADRAEANEKVPRVEELPAGGSSAAEGLRPPLPYRRIKPGYTRLASYYDVTATIDIEADIGADGRVLRTEIVRWGGFGLDESVTETVEAMNWRPADRDGRTIPMRVLLRYNFKK